MQVWCREAAEGGYTQEGHELGVPIWDLIRWTSSRIPARVEFVVTMYQGVKVRTLGSHTNMWNSLIILNFKGVIRKGNWSNSVWKFAMQPFKRCTLLLLFYKSRGGGGGGGQKQKWKVAEIVCVRGSKNPRWCTFGNLHVAYVTNLTITAIFDFLWNDAILWTSITRLLLTAGSANDY